MPDNKSVSVTLCRWCKYPKSGREKCLNPNCPGPHAAIKSPSSGRKSKRGYLIQPNRKIA